MPEESMPVRVIAFKDQAMAPRETLTDDKAIVDKPYRSRSWRHFQGGGSGAFAGIWEAEEHLERVDCDYDEICHIISGTVRLTDAQGTARTFGPGETFAVQRGFRGTWENLTKVRKVFCIIPHST